jgi:pyruvate/2-oxoglutarate dehydrogenase complex dihydrolipoamide dehydrogenase (E3) component
MNHINSPEPYDVIVFGAGTAGKVIAWNMAKAGRRTAVVERKYIGGNCPNVACLPSKNVIYSAKVASLVARHREFGIETGPAAIDMARVYARKRETVDAFVKIHLDKFKATGDELILGEGRFVAPHDSCGATRWRGANYRCRTRFHRSWNSRNRARDAGVARI